MLKSKNVINILIWIHKQAFLLRHFESPTFNDKFKHLFTHSFACNSVNWLIGSSD